MKGYATHCKYSLPLLSNHLTASRFPRSHCPCSHTAHWAQSERRQKAVAWSGRYDRFLQHPYGRHKDGCNVYSPRTQRRNRLQLVGFKWHEHVVCPLVNFFVVSNGPGNLSIAQQTHASGAASITPHAQLARVAR